MTEQSPRQPRSIADIGEAWLELMTSERATTQEGAAEARGLLAEAHPHRLWTQLSIKRAGYINRETTAETVCLIVADVTSTAPKRHDSMPNAPILVHPTVAAVDAKESTIAKLELLMKESDEVADWPKVELAGRALIDVYLAPVSRTTNPTAAKCKPYWGRIERALPKLFDDLLAAFTRHVAEVERVNNLSKIAKLA